MMVMMMRCSDTARWMFCLGSVEDYVGWLAKGWGWQQALAGHARNQSSKLEAISCTNRSRGKKPCSSLLRASITTEPHSTLRAACTNPNAKSLELHRAWLYKVDSPCKPGEWAALGSCLRHVAQVSMHRQFGGAGTDTSLVLPQDRRGR